MADRKVLVKYYPPDFDWDKLQQRKKQLKIYNRDKKRRRGDVYDEQKRPTGRIMNVRFMFPFTMKCGTCGEFIYVGTKFNSRVEKVEGEDYLGIVKWRFYGKCTSCRAEICFKTDPQNCDYVLEWGGSRMYEPLKDQALAAERLEKEMEDSMKGDRMKQLEANRQSMQGEIAALEQLQELQRINRRLIDKQTASDSAWEFLKKFRIQFDETEQVDENEDEEAMKDFRRMKLLADAEIESSDEENGVKEASEKKIPSSSSSLIGGGISKDVKPKFTVVESGCLGQKDSSSPRSGDEVSRSKKALKIKNEGIKSEVTVDSSNVMTPEGNTSKGVANWTDIQKCEYKPVNFGLGVKITSPCLLIKKNGENLKSKTSNKNEMELPSLEEQLEACASLFGDYEDDSD